MRERIEAWKSIAAALGVSVATAKRYERKRGLPVQRSFRGPWVAVTELLEWGATHGLTLSSRELT